MQHSVSRTYAPVSFMSFYEYAIEATRICQIDSIGIARLDDLDLPLPEYFKPYRKRPMQLNRKHKTIAKSILEIRDGWIYERLHRSYK